MKPFVDKSPSLTALLEECLRPTSHSLVKFQVRQLAAQEKSRRLFTRLYEKDPYTFYHSLRVAELVTAFGTHLDFSPEKLIDLCLCALFHDIGKIFTPDSVLKKPGKLSDEEFIIMKLHPLDSQKLVESVATLKHLGPWIRCHHERWDGKGYPDGNKGKDIPLYARMILLADTYDAMTSTRVYRSNRGPEDAYAEIVRCTGTQFDPTLAPQFIEAHKKLNESSILRDRPKAA